MLRSARGIRSLIPAALAAFLVPCAHAQDQDCQATQIAKLLAPDGAAEDRFGQSVGICGNTVVVGAHKDDDLGDGSGSASVFRFDGASWVYEAKLLALDGAPFDDFGFVVAISGDCILVAAPSDTDNGPLTGAVYVFRRGESGWVQEDKWTPDTGFAVTGYGFSLAIEGDVALVGAAFDTGPTVNQGAAYVYRYDGTEWNLETKLVPVSTDGSIVSPESVALSGNIAVLGAPSESVESYYAGAAYVFRYDGAAWTQEARITRGDPLASNSFGISVAASGDAVLVGSLEDLDGDFSGNGAAYVFRADGGDWNQEARLVASDTFRGDQFSRVVALEGDVALMGSLGNDAGGPGSGAAYIYRFDGATWNESAKFLSEDIAASDRFGESVALHNGRAIVSAEGDDDHGLQSGSEYLFDLSCGFACTADVNCDGSLTPADFTAWIAAFNANAAECDQNGDSLCTPADFTAWIANYNAGC